MTERPVIYVLRNADGAVFYVGRSRSLRSRLNGHRGRFGRHISLEVIQKEFDGETPARAEKRWIRHYVEALSGNLANVVHAPEALGKEASSLPPETDMTRSMVSIRKVDEDRWNAVQEKAVKEGRRVWAVLDELFDHYLKK